MNTIKNFFNTVKCFDSLPADTVRVLVAKAKKGDKVAISQVILSHQKFIFYTAKKFGFIHSNLKKENFEDIMSAGDIGLMEAINRYDSTKSTSFFTCAEFGIRNALEYNAHNSRKDLYLPIAKTKELSSIKKLIANCENIKKDMIQEEKIEYAAKATGKSVEGIKEILTWDSCETSIEENREKKKTSLQVFSCNQTQIVDDEIMKGQVKTFVTKALSSIPKRHQFIIANHFGIGCEKLRLSQIANKMDITKQRVALIEKEGFSLILNGNYAKQLKEFIS